MNSEQLEKTFDRYLDALMQKKGLDQMPEEKQSEFRERAKEMLVDQFNTAVLRQMPEDKLEEFENALDNGASTDELGKMIEKAGIDVAKTLENVVDAFSETVMELDINTVINNTDADAEQDAEADNKNAGADDAEADNNMKAEA